MTIFDGQTRYLSELCTRPSLLENYFYSAADLARMRSLVDLIKRITPTVTSTSVLFLVTGSMFFVFSILEFGQVPALYLFLGVSMPSNLRSVLASFLESQSVSLLQLNFPDPFGKLGDYHRPKTYEEFDVSLNFLSTSMWSILQTVVGVSLYWLLGTLFKYINAPICRKMHRRFKRGMYSNCAMVYQIVQVQLTFRAASTFLDPSMHNYYNLVNWCVSAVFMFLCSVGPFAHYVYMKKNKCNTCIFIEDCESFSKATYRRSEQYAISRIICNTSLALTIALASNAFSLVTTLLLQLYHLLILLRVTFNSRFLKWTRCLQSLAQFIFHCTFVVFFWAPLTELKKTILGLLCIGCLLNNILLEFLEMFYNIAIRLRKLFCCQDAKNESGPKPERAARQKYSLTVEACNKSELEPTPQSNLTIKQAHRTNKIKPLVIRFVRNTKRKKVISCVSGL